MYEYGGLRMTPVVVGVGGVVAGVMVGVKPPPEPSEESTESDRLGSCRFCGDVPDGISLRNFCMLVLIISDI